MGPTLNRRAVLGCAIALSLSTASHAAETHTFTMGLVGAPTAPESDGLRAMADYVSSHTDGRITIDIQYAGALGGEREMLEGVQLGTIDLEFLATAVIGNFDPDIQILDTPFLYNDLAQAEAVLSGPIGARLMEPFEAHGFIGLALGGNGFRQLTNNVRPVLAAEDVDGLKLRTMENPVYVEVWKTLGALPTPMSITEVYPALQQGVVDGQENPIGAIINNRFDEVQKYVSLINYSFNSAAIVMSPVAWDQLSEADRAVMRAGAQEAFRVTFETVAAQQSDGIAHLRSKGLTVEEHPDLQGFRDRLGPVYDKIYARFGEDRVREIQDYGK